jgi:phosphoenolpyruvate carboxylase
MKKNGSQSYITCLVSKLTDLYLEVLSESDQAVDALVQKKYAIQNTENKAERMCSYITFWASLDETQQFALSTHDAKINQLSRMARVIATTEIVWAHNSIKATNAGSLDFVLERFREGGFTPAQVQKFINQNAQAWVSLTGHPTNPTTLDYTLAQTKVAATIADPQAEPEDLKKALIILRDTPIVGPHKTPLEEAQETLGTLDVLYDSAIGLKRLFESALEKHGYTAEGVKIERSLIRPCVWTLGDGDGNQNLTAQVLEDGIALHRRRIAERYAQTGAVIIKHAQEDGINAPVLQDIKDLIHDCSPSAPVRPNKGVA